MTTTRRIRKCKACGERFLPQLQGAITCSPNCALDWAHFLKEKAFKLETQRRREALMTVTDWADATQPHFNRFILLRDAGLPCVSCGRTTGRMNAGHYRPKAGPNGVGALRFCEIAVHAQCVHCNDHLSGNAAMFAIGLEFRIGKPLVDWLDAQAGPMTLDIDELKSLKKYYAQRNTELRRHHVRAAEREFANASA